MQVLNITENQGYFVLSLKERFEEKGYEFKMVNADMESVDLVSTMTDAVIIYADEGIMDKQQELCYFKDKVIEEDIPVFIIGTYENIKSVEKMLPKHLIQKEFVRPFDAADIFNTVDEAIIERKSGKRKKILVVDDSGITLRNVKGWLEDKYQVILANSGAMAIKYLSINKPDLILLDYDMPIVDGKLVLEMIRNEVEFADIPVFFLTGKSDKESIMSVMNLKPEGYILKSTDTNLIVQTIDDFFMKQKAKRI